MTSERIAIVGMGLRYPDASTPDELWTNVLAGRRAFRNLPQERTSLSDYWDPDPAALDKFYSTKAAVLRDYEFDRVSRLISSATAGATDMTHWLALDVAERALADAGFAGGEGLPRQRTSVVLGNTLTGEFSRANVLRLRWPYVRRTVAAQLTGMGWDLTDVEAFVRDLEPAYKAPFPVPDEDMLAGGLANTIAGRICNYFDLGAGGYTVDGACSSSLLSVINAANALRVGDADVVLAGGVDLSIDPFELVGFAKTGALATREMVVYDRDSNGFWPGEGCAMVVLMREADAIAQGRRIIACIAGWGMSSDGKGGITRPEESGHRRALAAAYARAGYEASTVAYFEGHGTGTAVGDATEIAALASTREGVDDPWPAALSSLKANIGHTKAAAGVAGLIKAALSVHHQVIPPASGHSNPHPLLSTLAHAVHVPTAASTYRRDIPVRAGVSAMGFGGINTHIALESADRAGGDPSRVTDDMRALVAGRQDAELLMFATDDRDSLVHTLVAAARTLERASFAELTDLAVTLQQNLGAGPHRVSVVARTPAEAVARITRVIDHLSGHPDNPSRVTRIDEGSWCGTGDTPGRVAFAFPGQGAGHGLYGQVLRRFDAAEFTGVDADAAGTAGLQPRVVARSLQGVDILAQVGVHADTAIGHSLGEITALAWAGALTTPDACDVAHRRGKVMGTLVPRTGAMAVIGAEAALTETFLQGTGADISGYNAPRMTVIAGTQASVDAAAEAATRAGIQVTILDVEHAFHTKHCDDAAAALADELAGTPFGQVHRPVLSTSALGTVPQGEDLCAYLVAQVTRPVRFAEAVQDLRGHDLVIEVGPGRTLSGLIGANLPTIAAVSMDTDAGSLVPYLDTVGAVHCAGHTVNTEPLTSGRAHRPLEPGQEMTFLSNPCETAPALGFVPAGGEPDQAPGAAAQPQAGTTLEVLLGVVSEKVDLPVEVLGANTSPLEDLHLSSITVGQITNDVLRALGRGPLTGVPSFATASLGAIAEMIDEMGDVQAATSKITGAAPWIRIFGQVHHPEPLLAPPVYGKGRPWGVIGEATTPTVQAIRRRLDRLPNLDPGILVSTSGHDPKSGTDAIEGTLELLGDIYAGRPVVVLQQGTHGAAAAARSLFLEHVTPQVTVVHLPEGADHVDEATADSIVADVADNNGFTEVTYHSDRTRSRGSWGALDTGVRPDADRFLGPSDLLLVSGGGKGITAECALELAKESGCSLALLGRAPDTDPTVARTLERASRAGVVAMYVSADVTDGSDVARAVSEVTRTLGPITGLVHGAGSNEPVRATDLTRATLDRTIATKVHGFRHLVAALDPAQLRLVIGFGSIIGRAGLEGEVHYATANDWLTEEVVAFGRANPHLRARSVEWSVWSGAGMGERLGVLETLKQRGIEPIPSDWGVRLISTLVDHPDLPNVVVVSGRTGQFPTMHYTPGSLPLYRFLERPVVHYPGVELVVEAELGAATDLYLADHVLDGEMVFPAVLGMEAMAQVAAALKPSFVQGLALKDVRFERPVVVPTGGTETIRIAGVIEGDNVRVVIRTAATGFAVDHFSAVIIPRPDNGDGLEPGSLANLEPVALDPGRDLYGSLMFQGHSFQKLRNYRVALARRAVAELDVSSDRRWFSLVHPSDMVLADPGARDAMMHAIQCCVPDAVLLPEGIDLLVPAMGSYSGACVVMEAHEQSNVEESFAYDVACHDQDGRVESWTGLRLRAVKRRPARGMSWNPAMTGPYLQRSFEGIVGAQLEVAVEPHPVSAGPGRGELRTATDRAIARLRPAAELQRRGDGRLVLDADTNGCSSHHADFTMAVVGASTVACDTEAVTPRSDQTWQSLLGNDWALAKEIAATTSSSINEAGTRVWGALECVRKAGHSSIGLSLAAVHDDRVTVAAGNYVIGTWVLPTGPGQADTMFALLGGQL